jgi:hypothetical protein
VEFSMEIEVESLLGRDVSLEVIIATHCCDSRRDEWFGIRIAMHRLSTNTLVSRFTPT